MILAFEHDDGAAVLDDYYHCMHRKDHRNLYNEPHSLALRNQGMLARSLGSQVGVTSRPRSINSTNAKFLRALDWGHLATCRTPTRSAHTNLAIKQRGKKGGMYENLTADPTSAEALERAIS
jgi:hypothetical protein